MLNQNKTLLDENNT